MARMFGTDGLRGVANDTLTCELAMRLGMAGAYVLANEVHRPKIILGSDTRKSKDMLAGALIAGICSIGGDVLNVGVLPTPAMPFLTRAHGADAAVMISASHNPMQDNGIKWFNNKGYKLSDKIEDRIEELLHSSEPLSRPTGEGIGCLIEVKRAQEEYTEFLCSTARRKLTGLKVALDCANGASSLVAPEVFTRLGAEVLLCAASPNGCNINRSCGSTHIDNLQRFVAESGADIGFAFDGDADRVIAVDEHGNVIDGDRMMGLIAIAMSKAGTLKNNTLVTTVMSNIGLKRKMRDVGINVAETTVGDRYVLECMLNNDYNFGGEQSGHIIFLDHNTSGDGMLTAIQVMNVMLDEGETLSKLASDIPIFPQILVNVELSPENKEAAKSDKDMLARIHEVETKLGDGGRVLVRASGTEPLIRVMLEGEDIEAITQYAIYIAEVLENNYGAKIRR